MNLQFTERFVRKGLKQIFIPTLCSEMQGQAVTVADSVVVMCEVKTCGGFDYISLKFRSNWLFTNANPFLQSKPGTSKSPLNTTLNILIHNTNE
jgi:hypothetical protein